MLCYPLAQEEKGSELSRRTWRGPQHEKMQRGWEDRKDPSLVEAKRQICVKVLKEDEESSEVFDEAEL